MTKGRGRVKTSQGSGAGESPSNQRARKDASWSGGNGFGTAGKMRLLY